MMKYRLELDWKQLEAFYAAIKIAEYHTEEIICSINETLEMLKEKESGSIEKAEALKASYENDLKSYKELHSLVTVLHDEEAKNDEE